MSTPEDKPFFTCSPCLAQNLPFAGQEVSDNDIPDNEISFDVSYDCFEAIKNEKRLKMTHLNINGLPSKIDYI